MRHSEIDIIWKAQEEGTGILSAMLARWGRFLPAVRVSAGPGVHSAVFPFILRGTGAVDFSIHAGAERLNARTRGRYGVQYRVSAEVAVGAGLTGYRLEASVMALAGLGIAAAIVSAEFK